MNNRRESAAWLVQCLAVLAILSTAACDGSRSSQSSSAPVATQPTQVVRFASTPQVLAAPALVAEGKHLWATDSQLKVETSELLSGRLILDAVLGGSADIGLAADTPLTVAASQAKELVILATITQSTKGDLVIGRTDRGVTSPVGLRGHSVAIYKGTSSEYYLDLTLQGAGLKRSDLKEVIHLEPPDMVNAMVAGQVDAAVIWEPHLTAIRRKLGAKAVMFSGSIPYNLTFNVFTRRDYPMGHVKEAAAVLRGLISATEFMRANRDESVRLIAAKLQLEPDVVAGFWDTYHFDVLLQDTLLAEMARQARWLRDRGQITETRDEAFFRRFLDPSVLKQLAPASVNVK